MYVGLAQKIIYHYLVHGNITHGIMLGMYKVVVDNLLIVAVHIHKLL